MSILPDREKLAFTTDQLEKLSIPTVYIGPSLKNHVHHCRCNTFGVVLTFWHSRKFSKQFMSGSSAKHLHVGDPCVVCALHAIFQALSTRAYKQAKAITDADFRIALSNLYPENSFSEKVCQVAVIIFDILHESGTSGSGVSNESSESKCIGSWNGASHACIAHENFDKAAIVESICSYCVRDFRETNYTTEKYALAMDQCMKKAIVPGLRTEVGEGNCSLNLFVLALWHSREFRDQFMCGSTANHLHIGDPCVVCAICEIFHALSTRANMQEKAISAASLRIALSKLYPENNFFEEASKVSAAIFDILHDSGTSGSGVSTTDSSGGKCIGSWNGASHACIAHENFEKDAFVKMTCSSCVIDSRKTKHTTDALQEQKNSPFPTSVRVKNIHGSDTFGPGLKNDVGECICSLDVIVKSLWNVRKFREIFFSRPPLGHLHIGDPCVVCALKEMFNVLNVGSANGQMDAAFMSLTGTMRKLYSGSNFLKEAHMTDASENLRVICDCIHKSFISCSGLSDAESSGIKCSCTWKYFSDDCEARKLFGVDLSAETTCVNRQHISEKTYINPVLKYSTFFFDLSLGPLNVPNAASPFAALSKPERRTNCQQTCDPVVEGYLPHMFALGWEPSGEGMDHFMLSFLKTEIHLGALFESRDPGKQHSLISMVCYSGQHYVCFTFSHEYKEWITYRHEHIKVIGCWDDVLSTCERGHLQPQLLFYEAVN